ncbi:MAG TPA: DNA topoisomerase IB [Actinomycetota bacterium]|nr:DNA topoisomerase IB [Actinomycetota bacterium]
MPRIRRVQAGQPGLHQRRRGRGFCYEDAGGHPVSDPQTLERIRGLTIPPAWSDVWICADPWGHIQATGTDAAGRRQYLYHERWRRWRDRRKFRRMLAFGRALPGLRDVVEEHLEARDLSRERVLACAVRLLDLGGFRVGGEIYAERNGSFGLATLRKEHVRVRGEAISFDFTAKGGKRRVLVVSDPGAAAVLRSLKARRDGGGDLLAHREGRDWRDVRSADINAYLKEVAGDGFTAKDFRTWNATVLAAVAVAARSEVGPSLRARKRAAAAAMKQVAEHLGNTPSVCRASYVDPRVIDRFLEGEVAEIPRIALDDDGVLELDDRSLREAVEAAVLRLLAGSVVPVSRRPAA